MKITSAVRAFWNEFTADREDVGAADPFQIWHFGNSPELASELLDLVLKGRKFGTSSLPWEFEDEPEMMPTPGAFSVVTDFQGDPKCVVQTTRVRTVPYNEVDAEHAFAEGEGDQSLDHWRGVHWEYFSRQCVELSRVPSETMPVICEEFVLLFPVRAGE